MNSGVGGGRKAKGGSSMDTLDTLNERRAKIYEDIKRLISPALGPDVDFDQEVEALHHIWHESPD